MKGNNFHREVVVGTMIAPVDINNTNVDSNVLVEPWNTHRQVAFLLQGGVLGSSANGAFTFEGRKRSDGAFETLKDGSGNNLVLDGARFDDTGAIEGATLLGTLPLSDVDATTYDGIRINFANSVAVVYLVAVAYVLFDALDKPTAQVDEIFPLMRP